MSRQPVIDFHCHILPCIDDGSSSVKMSLEMLDIMRKSGIGYAVATPHFYCKNEEVDSFLKRRKKSFETLLEAIPSGSDFPIVLPAAEVALNSGLEKCDLHKLCICDSDIILIEMPYSEWTDDNFSMLETVCFDKKLTVIIAHLERFLSIQSDMAIKRILELPVFIQINSGDFGRFFFRKELASLFEKGEAHLLGSDCHNLSSRVPNLSIARDYLEKKYGKSILETVDENGLKLLKKIQTEKDYVTY